MGWASRANRSAEQAKALGYRKPKTETSVKGRRVVVGTAHTAIAAALLRAISRRRPGRLV